MNPDEALVATPWNTKCLGMDTFEIVELTREILESIESKSGHYTVRVDPLSCDKQLLHEAGFYYCDTLVEQVILKNNYNYFDDNHITCIETDDAASCKEIILDLFQFDHFHRDFNIENATSDLRYLNWIDELCSKNSTYLFCYNGEIAGFIAFDKNKLFLAAIAKAYRGKGLAKYFLSSICNKIFADGYEHIFGFISFANVPVVNLYASLGARFRGAVDIYHKIVKKQD